MADPIIAEKDEEQMQNDFVKWGRDWGIRWAVNYRDAVEFFARQMVHMLILAKMKPIQVTAEIMENRFVKGCPMSNSAFPVNVWGFLSHGPERPIKWFPDPEKFCVRIQQSTYYVPTTGQMEPNTMCLYSIEIPQSLRRRGLFYELLRAIEYWVCVDLKLPHLLVAPVVEEDFLAEKLTDYGYRQYSPLHFCKSFQEVGSEASILPVRKIGQYFASCREPECTNIPGHWTETWCRDHQSVCGVCHRRVRRTYLMGNNEPHPCIDCASPCDVGWCDEKAKHWEYFRKTCDYHMSSYCESSRYPCRKRQKCATPGCSDARASPVHLYCLPCLHSVGNVDEILCYRSTHGPAIKHPEDVSMNKLLDWQRCQNSVRGKELCYFHDQARQGKGGKACLYEFKPEQYDID